jgi:hypothetical protein
MNTTSHPFSPVSQRQTVNSELALHGWTQRLGMSFEEFEALMAAASPPRQQGHQAAQDELPLPAPADFMY